MENKKLGCLTRGGIAGLAIAIIAVGITFGYSKYQMFSPGELTARNSGRQLNNISSHFELKEDCQVCHPAPWDSIGMADLCLECHQNVADQLEDSHSLHGAAVSVLSSNDCRECHTDHLGQEAAITEFEADNFPHALVGFSLTSHQDLDSSEVIHCADCHPASFLAFDQILCQECHAKIDRPFAEDHSKIYSEDCLACHDGKETIRAAYNHSQTAFSLTGKHVEIRCQACHINTTNLELFRTAPGTCFACHRENDLHLGFLGESCENCHTPQGWIPGQYDHTQTGFLLNGGHGNLICRDCHLEPTFQDLSPDCIFCHQEDEPHQGDFGTDCTICHSVVSWDFIHFDHTSLYAENCIYCHQEDSPAEHYQGQCSACHIVDGWLPATFNHAAAGATDCQTCHIQDRPADHFAGQCSLCHITSRWKPAYINHTFPVTHGGAGNRCALCHPSNNYYSYSCYQCHEHSKSEIKNEHEGISNLENCLRCHWDGRKHEDGGDGDED